MIYIAIPAGWTFVKAETQKRVERASSDDSIISELSTVSAGSGAEAIPTMVDAKDRLINDELGCEIILQDIIKECLRTKKCRDLASTVVQDKSTYGFKLTIYYKKPPSTADLFLMYEPEQNGKYSSSYTKMVVGQETQTKYSTNRHVSWYVSADLSVERRAVVEALAAEQRANRRHDGPSPCATQC